MAAGCFQVCNLLNHSGVGLHFAVDVEFGSGCLSEFCRLDYFVNLVALSGTLCGETEHCHLGVDAGESLGCLCANYRDVSELLSGGRDSYSTVGKEEHAVLTVLFFGNNNDKRARYSAYSGSGLDVLEGGADSVGS